MVVKKVFYKKDNDDDWNLGSFIKNTILKENSLVIGIT